MSCDDGMLLLGWGKRRNLPTPDISGVNPQFYFPDYFLTKQLPWFVYEQSTTIEAKELQQLLPTGATTSSASYQWHNPHKEIFRSAFDELQQKFSTGEIAKAVPFVMESAMHTMDSALRLKTIKSLLTYVSSNPAYIYGFWDQTEGMLGATPEILFRNLGNGALETVACAGTKRINEDTATFLNDPKELHEHQLVIDGIIESLRPFGEVKIGSMQLLKLTRLMHLFTPITVELKTMPQIEEIVKALHPTPAVGGLPRTQAMQWLKAFQKKIDRRHFAAPAGYLLPKTRRSSCYVSIRNVQWNKTQMDICAGCGLVPGSQFEKEWAEINLKLSAIKELLSL